MEDLAKQLSAQLPEREKRRYLNAISEFSTGRPTLFDPAVTIPTALFHFAQGATVCQVCVELGISRSTYYLWTKTHEAFMDTHKKGRTLSRAMLESLAMDNIENPKFSFLLLESRMRREFNLDETPNIEIEGFDDAKNDAERIMLVMSALATGKVSSSQALQLVQILKTVQEITTIPDLLSQLDNIKSRIKEI
tara:strand:+ start:46 stop:624 length:579 start_codon:yes stop_codon:yes gene_type:complete